jgi:hypothetical protein
VWLLLKLLRLVEEGARLVFVPGSHAAPKEVHVVWDRIKGDYSEHAITQRCAAIESRLAQHDNVAAQALVRERMAQSLRAVSIAVTKHQQNGYPEMAYAGTRLVAFLSSELVSSSLLGVATVQRVRAAPLSSCSISHIVARNAGAVDEAAAVSRRDEHRFTSRSAAGRHTPPPPPPRSVHVAGPPPAATPLSARQTDHAAAWGSALAHYSGPG